MHNYISFFTENNLDSTYIYDALDQHNLTPETTVNELLNLKNIVNITPDNSVQVSDNITVIQPLIIPCVVFSLVGGIIFKMRRDIHLDNKSVIVDDTIINDNKPVIVDDTIINDSDNNKRITLNKNKNGEINIVNTEYTSKTSTSRTNWLSKYANRLYLIKNIIS